MFTSILSLGLVSLLATTSTAAPTPAPLVARNANKKGVAYENPAAVPLFGDKVSWCYNWVSASKFGSGTPGNIEFVPMLHSDEAMWTNVWAAEFEASYQAGARHVLSFNEPDQCGYVFTLLGIFIYHVTPSIPVDLPCAAMSCA